MQIRKARINDIRGLLKLATALTESFGRKDSSGGRFSEYTKRKPGYNSMLEKWFSKNIYSKNAIVYVAEDEGNLIGYVLSYIAKEVPIYVVDKTGYISDLYVLPEYRGKGIASEFKNLSFEWFRSKEIRHASIKTYTSNRNAREIYAHWGFFEHSVGLRMKI